MYFRLLFWFYLQIVNPKGLQHSKVINLSNFFSLYFYSFPWQQIPDGSCPKNVRAQMSKEQDYWLSKRGTSWSHASVWYSHNFSSCNKEKDICGAAVEGCAVVMQEIVHQSPVFDCWSEALGSNRCYRWKRRRSLIYSDFTLCGRFIESQMPLDYLYLSKLFSYYLASVLLIVFSLIVADSVFCVILLSNLKSVFTLVTFFPPPTPPPLCVLWCLTFGLLGLVLGWHFGETDIDLTWCISV